MTRSIPGRAGVASSHTQTGSDSWSDGRDYTSAMTEHPAETPMPLKSATVQLSRMTSVSFASGMDCRSDDSLQRRAGRRRPLYGMC